jgi:hypothetical protein
VTGERRAAAWERLHQDVRTGYTRNATLWVEAWPHHGPFTCHFSPCTFHVSPRRNFQIRRVLELITLPPLSQEPQQFAVCRLHLLGGETTVPGKNPVDHGLLGFVIDDEGNATRRIDQGKGKCQPMGIKLWDKIGHHILLSLLQSGRLWKQRRGVTILSQAEQD